MTAAVEAGREEKTDDFDGQSRTDDTTAMVRMLASLWRRQYSAENMSWQRAARIP